MIKLIYVRSSSKPVDSAMNSDLATLYITPQIGSSYRQVCIQISPNEKVSKIKEEFGEWNRVHPARVYLIYTGKAMADDKILSQYGISNDTYIIHMVEGSSSPLVPHY